MKRILSVIVSVTMFVALLPCATVSAKVYGDLQYEVRDGYVEITGCKGTVKSVNIPTEIEGLPVTNIADNTFSGLRDLTSVYIPESITGIGVSAFANCSGLPSIVIPGSVTSIGQRAFEHCTGLKNITLSNGVKTIGDSAFWGCVHLSNIAIPDSVTNLSWHAFYNTADYKNVNNWVDGFLYLDNWLVDSKDISDINSYTIIPGTRGIAGGVFNECYSLANVNIPDSVRSIGPLTFSHCIGLTSINISGKLANICSNAFYECAWLETVKIQSELTSIEDSVFEGCAALSNISLPDSVTYIGDSAFSNCTSLESIDIPNNVTQISMHMFSGCTNLKSITIPTSVTSIGRFAFDDCNSLMDIYYGGLEEDWKELYIDNYYNEPLENATIHYQSTGNDPSNTPTPAPANYSYKINSISLVSETGENLTSAPANSAFLVDVDITETRNRAAKDYLFVAVYDTKGALLSLDYVKSDFVPDNSFEIGFHVPAQSSDIGSIKAFIWNGFGSNVPLAEPVEI